MYACLFSSMEMNTVIGVNSTNCSVLSHTLFYTHSTHSLNEFSSSMNATFYNIFNVYFLLCFQVLISSLFCSK